VIDPSASLLFKIKLASQVQFRNFDDKSNGVVVFIAFPEKSNQIEEVL